MLEVVYHALSVQEIHCRSKEIPVERPCEREILRPAWYMGDGDDFFEGYDLEGRNDANYIYMP